MTALLVEEVEVELMLGPESYLCDLAQRAINENRERYRLVLRSYAMAVVLLDLNSIWSSVIEAVCKVGHQFGEYPDAG